MVGAGAGTALATPTPPVHSGAVQGVAGGQDWSSAGYWANDNYHYILTQGGQGAGNNYQEHGTFTAMSDPMTGTPLSATVEGTFDGVLNWDFTSGAPVSMAFTYRVPSQGWVFKESQQPGGQYTQWENHPLQGG